MIVAGGHDRYAGLFDDELDDVADRMGAAADAARTAEDVSTEQAPDGRTIGVPLDELLDGAP